MRRALLIILCFLPVSRLNALGTDESNRQRDLDVVLCLDLSGSTNGLIEDFREHFWYITNQLMVMNPRPRLRIGVVGFSRPSFGKNNAYVKVISDITDDLDAVAANVFALRRSIEKGDQYVVPALQTCMSLNWSKSPDAVKLIFLAGNGMADAIGQGYTKIAETAKSKGILIHSLYVLSSGNKLKEMPAWRRIAGLSGGRTSEITIGVPDTTTVWKNISANSVANNNRTMNVIRWNAMTPECRQFAVTSDSGAFVSSPDEWMNRIAYKGSEAHLNYLDRWGAFTTQDGRKEKDLGDDVFSRKIKEGFADTRLVLNSCKKEAPESFIREHHQYFKEGLFKESGHIRRVLILFSMHNWGEITLSDE